MSSENMRNTKIRWNISKAFNLLNKALYESQLKLKKTKEIETAIEHIKTLYDINSRQAMLLVVVVVFNFSEGDREMDFSSIANFLGLNVMDVVEMVNDFRTLHAKKLIKYNATKNLFKSTRAVLKSVLENCKPVYEVGDEKKNSFGFLNIVRSQIEDFKWENISLLDLYESIDRIEADNSDIEFVQKCKDLISDDVERIMFYDICYCFSHDRDSNLQTMLEDCYFDWEIIESGKSFMNGTHFLIKSGLVEIESSGMFSDANVVLSKKSKELVLGENVQYFIKQIDEKYLMKIENIKPKELFYSEQNQKQIDVIKRSLEEKRFADIQNRLRAEAMPVGIAVLLYGAPGTGKTESVLQIARETGRNIVHVNISESKSCWYGESEKKIKEIFDNYRNMCKIEMEKDDGKIPILLFNEADAIFGKRHESNSGSLEQTENAMQNIILEEMENLEGILIATTNLADNLDAAFERRFLFKVKFDKPSVEAKAKIWHSKLNWLSESDVDYLASAYNFSGGEIDNIVRKVTMSEVVSGERPSFEELKDFCKTEKLFCEQGRTIGFMC